MLKYLQTLFWNRHTVAYSPQWANAAPSCRAFLPNCSCKIEITVPCDMPVASTSSRIFIRQLVKTISWILSTISGVAISIGCPKRSASHVDVRPRLNSFTQLYTVANAVHYPTRLWFLSALNLSYVWLLHETRFFAKNTKFVRFNHLQKWNHAMNSKFYSNQLRDATCQKVMWRDECLLTDFLRIYWLTS